MKKLTLILAALVLTLGFSQCKKAETPTTDEGVFITLTAGYGNGAKTSFDPANGAFAWTGTTESPEYIYVGGNSTGYLGYLTSTESGATVNFSGTITPGAADATLYFFYLGKGDHAAATSVDFSNQDGTLENVTNYHIAISDGVEYTGQTSFSTTLNMKMAIAYFDVDGFKSAGNAAETVYLHGDEVYSTATINYRAGTITGDAKGNINLGTASSGKYVALIPSVNTETTLSFDSNSKWGALNFMRGIQAGRYYSNSGAALTVTAGTLLAGTIPGLFSVSATKMVRFSKGNLQYIGSAETPYWRFADNQWDYLGDNGQNGYATNVDRDLFGWGTGNNPNLVSEEDVDYPSFNEWGANAISNGGNTPAQWYTLSKDEWGYLSNSRSTTSGVFFAKAKVNNERGVIILSDDWSSSNYTLDNTNEMYNAYFTSNIIDLTDWTNAFVANGAVFLPAAGYRMYGEVIAPGDGGHYWSSSPDNTTDNTNHAYTFNFSQGVSGSQHRCGGQSVRLVHNAGLIVDSDIVNDVTTGGSIFSGWTNGGGDPWNDPTPGSGGSTLGGWNNDGNDPWGN